VVASAILEMWVVLTFSLLGLCLWIYLRWRDDLREAESLRAQAFAELEKTKELQDDIISQIHTRQKAIFNSMVEGILILDQNGRVHSTNKSLERVFSINRDILGMTLIEAFHCHELLEVVDKAQKEGLVSGFELKLTRIHQTQYLEVNAAAIQRAGSQPEGTILIFHDFTRIKELESLRREFVANVSHELRTPLTLIKGYVETLMDGAKDDPAVSTKFLQTIYKHTNRLAFLIEDLLTLSHLESGQVIMHLQITPLYPIIERVLDELQSPAAQKKIMLENLVTQTLQVNADGDRLQQVFYNLVDNAIKYSNSGGHVSIGAEPQLDSMRIFVRDDGPGIPPDAQERIFERFFRVDRARSREAGGTGLGLSIVKHIIQAHGGKVWVQSEPGEGSTFYFTIPLKPA
jgi:two-component system phosphate regulon sensor histidine kinase PhoR